ncbi:MAG: hypothetical protein H7321_07880 [Bacteroidia bacterium]|nr:hypothetical protein [Bacteroidia bacterium]
MKKILLFFTFLFCYSNAIFAQGYFFTEKPNNLQLFPRNVKTNEATVIISGYTATTNFTDIKIFLYKNKVLTHTTIRPVTKNQSFSFKETLTAGRYNYDFKVYLTLLNGKDSLVLNVNSVLAGDAYFITGQSNSVAGNYNNSGSANASYSDSFIRSFGNISDLNDKTWYLADGDNYYTKGSVGQWGLVMAKKLFDNYGIPIAIINGGIGGRPITFFQYDPGDYDLITSPRSNYRQLEERINNAGFFLKLRGILFYQGESDGSNAKLHDSLYKKLSYQWNNSGCKPLHKNYVVQVRKGCGSPSLQLREYQRQFQFSLEKHTTVTVNGLNGHDGCHFNFNNGYEELGLNMARQLGRDLYGDALTEVEPLNIKYAYFSNAFQTELTLELYNSTDKLRADSGFYQYFSLNGGTSTIIGGKIRNNKIVLRLSASSCAIKGLNYDGPMYYGNWVTNTNKVAMLSFYNAPVYRSLKPQETQLVCVGTNIKPGIDSISGYTYNWKDLNGSWKSTFSNPVYSVSSATTLRLIVSSKNSLCMRDTFYVNIYVDDTRPVFKGIVQSACYSDFIRITIPKEYESWIITDSRGGQTTATDIFVNQEGTLKISAKSSYLGCPIKDSIKTLIYHEILNASNDTAICDYSSILLSANKGFASYKWNGVNGSDSFRTNAGTTSYLKAIDSKGCIYADTITVKSLKTVKPTLGADINVCRNDTLKLVVSSQLNVISWNNISSTAFKYNALNEPFVIVKTSDSNLCISSDTIQIGILNLPYFKFEKDTGFCAGSNILLKAPLNNGIYYNWQNGLSNRSTLLVNAGGDYSLKITDNQSCSFSDTINISTYKVAPGFLQNDTTICLGDTLELSVKGNFKNVLWNSLINTKTIKVWNLQNVSLKVTDFHGCEATETMLLSVKVCNTSVSSETISTINYWPNPHSGTVNIKSSDLINNITVYDLTGREIKSQIIISGNQAVISDLVNVPVIIKIMSDKGMTSKMLIPLQN